MHTVTIVDLPERVEITHENNFLSDSVTLLFRGQGELAVHCTAGHLANLADAVEAAANDLRAADELEP